MRRIVVIILLCIALMALIFSLLVLVRVSIFPNDAPARIEAPPETPITQRPQEQTRPFPVGVPFDYEETLPREIYVAPERTPDRDLDRRQVPPTGPPPRPMIAVVIDDMGVDRRRSARAVALPGSVTLAYLPYAEQLPHQTEAAKAAGHELLIHVPMEPSNPDIDAGPNVLRVGDPPHEIARKLQWALSQFHGYVGINNHMGSRFTADAAAMKIVMEELRERNLMFLDSRTVALSQAMTVALEAGVPFATRNVFLDHVDDRPAIDEQLRVLEQLAVSQGHAIAIGHPRDATLEALEEWLPTLAAKGIDLVPVSRVLAQETDITE